MIIDVPPIGSSYKEEEEWCLTPLLHHCKKKLEDTKGVTGNRKSTGNAMTKR
jgi:hypothetical protein